jgi:hypothetical protein
MNAKNVKEWILTLPNELPLWELKSQMNSHCGNWSPKWTPKSSERNCRGQNPLAWRVLYIIGKLSKPRCLKCTRMTHLDIWNTSYDQKKGRESNWQFDSQPLEVGNWPDFLVLKQCATYRWKILNEGYNFALDFIIIKGLHAEFLGLQSHESPSHGNFGTPTWESRDKMPFGCGPCGETQRIL